MADAIKQTSSDEQTTEQVKEVTIDYKTEAQKAFEARDNAKKEARELKQQLADLKKSIDSEKFETDKKSGDVAKIEDAWSKKLNTTVSEYEARVSQLEHDFQTAVVESKFKDLVADKVINPRQAFAVASFEGNSFAVQKNEAGDFEFVVKTKEGITRKDIDKFVTEFLDANPNLAKNPRKSGTGSELGNPAKIEVKDLSKLSYSEQREYFLKNPDAARDIKI